MDSDTTEYVKLIQTAFASSANDLRKSAETTLINKCCTQAKGMEILVSIMMSPD